MRWMHTTSGPPILLCSFIVLGLSVATALGGAGEAPRKGGTLRVASVTEPASLDAHWNLTGFTRFIADNSLEGLYTEGLDYSWIPMLAEGHTLSEDGLVYTIRLRRGVPFHHGKELTAADAVASLLRYGKLHVRGKQLFARVESVKALDHYTLQLRLQGKTALVLPLLGAGMIYPKEVLEEAGEGHVRTHIGTGPFKLAELQPGRHIKLVRFEQYQARPEPPNGRGGNKTPWVDTVLVMMHIPDDRVRLAALESGEVDLIPMRDFYDRLKANPDLKVQIGEFGMKAMTMLNKRKGLFTHVKLRQAALAALDMDPILRATVGHPELYRLDASLSFKDEMWWTDAGRERYNQNDPAKARRLLQEAGYQGEPVRYMVNQDQAEMHRLALVNIEGGPKTRDPSIPRRCSTATRRPRVAARRRGRWGP